MNTGKYEMQSRQYYREVNYGDINASTIIGLPGSVDSVTHKVYQLLNTDGTPLIFIKAAIIESVTIDVPTDLADGAGSTNFDLYCVEDDDTTFIKVEGSLAASSPKIEAKHPDVIASFGSRARVYLVPRVDKAPYTAGLVKINITGSEPVAY